ncbi:26S proteasome non-ATPase regulatory subunit 12 [Hysterangium stoloniferum]|nr:26S proteasome non-ATPase regulatory subunit 12 [Hysterangium stoloniferum]
MSSEPKKQERDFTPEVDALIPEVTASAKGGKLEDAIEKILSLEKQTRNASDLKSTTRLAETLLTLTNEARNYKLLTTNLVLLSKKHGQLKSVVQTMVELTMTWLNAVRETEGTETWLTIINALRDVTEGKIFLETPRARVTLFLAHYNEALSNSPSQTSPSPQECLQTASDLLSELQVETYSSMERREKTEFLLEQMRLLVHVAKMKDAEAKKAKESRAIADDGAGAGLADGEAEWVKVRVGGRKVNEGFLKEKDNEDLKLKYYELMIQYALHQAAYLDVAKHYYKIWETPSIKEDEAGKGRQALEYIVYYVILAPYDNEQSDMLHHLFVDPALLKMELHYNLVKCFTTRELMRWPRIEGIYGPTLRATTVFGDGGDKRWEDLHTRVIEHNIRVISHYYTRIHLSRLQSLLDLSAQQTEETLSRLVVSGSIWARIDRPAGIISFTQKRSAEDVLNDWSSDMAKLLSLVEKSWMGMNAALAAQTKV